MCDHHCWVKWGVSELPVFSYTLAKWMNLAFAFVWSFLQTANSNVYFTNCAQFNTLKALSLSVTGVLCHSLPKKLWKKCLKYQVDSLTELTFLWMCGNTSKESQEGKPKKTKMLDLPVPRLWLYPLTTGCLKRDPLSEPRKPLVCLCKVPLNVFKGPKLRCWISVAA